MKRRKTLTEEETRLLMIHIVDAITFMHDSNVIHCDLKLGNLFLSKNMDIKVGDFGLACRVDSTDEKRRTICGTPNYIAPGVIEGTRKSAGTPSKWTFGVGVICFTMLVANLRTRAHTIGYWRMNIAFHRRRYQRMNDD